MALDSGSRVALTGGTGFVGRHVIDHLVGQGFKVSALTRRPPEKQHPQIDWVSGDLSDEDALRTLVKGADAVVHIAGLIKARRREEFTNVNVDGTMRLLNAMIDTGAAERAQYIHVSSLAARNPALSHYAASKLKAESAVRSVGTGLKWVILRPPAVYGPGDEETLVFFKAATGRLALLPGSKRNRTSLIHVHDLARAISTAFTTDALIHQIADVHDGAPLGYGLRDVIKMIAGRDDAPPVIFIPKVLMQALGGMAWLASLITRKTPMLTPSKARELCFQDWICADRMLFDKADWRPRIPASQGLVETRTWYEQNNMI